MNTFPPTVTHVTSVILSVIEWNSLPRSAALAAPKQRTAPSTCQPTTMPSSVHLQRWSGPGRDWKPYPNPAVKLWIIVIQSKISLRIFLLHLQGKSQQKDLKKAEDNSISLFSHSSESLLGFFPWPCYFLCNQMLIFCIPKKQTLRSS